MLLELRLSDQPVVQAETGDALEVCGVVRDESQVVSDCNCGNHEICGGNRNPFLQKLASNLAELLGARLIEIQYLNVSD